MDFGTRLLSPSRLPWFRHILATDFKIGHRRKFGMNRQRALACLVPLITLNALYGQNGSTLVGTTHQWPSLRLMTTLLLMLWALGLLLLRRTLNVVKWHGRNDSISSGRWLWLSSIEL